MHCLDTLTNKQALRITHCFYTTLNVWGEPCYCQLAWYACHTHKNHLKKPERLPFGDWYTRHAHENVPKKPKLLQIWYVRCAHKNLLKKPKNPPLGSW